MKLLKRLLFGLLGLIALLLIVALFAKKDYTVEREIVIQKSDSLVFEYVKKLSLQKNWSTWSLMDPKMTAELKGEDGTVGSVWSWKSAMVGDGSQTIEKLDPPKRVDVKLHFLTPFESVAPGWIVTEAVSPTSTKVKWGMSMHSPYPTNLIDLVVNAEKMIGTEYEKSLVNLKTLLEK